MPPRAFPRGSMNQASVFYSAQWPKDFDDLFILGLCEQTGLGNFCSNGRPNRKAISYAKDRVNGSNGTHLSYDFFIDRFRRLYQRYIVFKHIIEQEGVEHNVISHHVTAAEGVWNTICREHALAYAYMREGEGHFDALEFIFTAVPEVPQAQAVDHGVEIIEISSDRDTISTEIDNGAVFDNELAWYNSVTSCNTGGLSTNISDTGTSRVRVEDAAINRSARRRSIPCVPPSSGPSSQASSSPYKPDY